MNNLEEVAARGRAPHLPPAELPGAGCRWRWPARPCTSSSPSCCCSACHRRRRRAGRDTGRWTVAAVTPRQRRPRAAGLQAGDRIVGHRRQRRSPTFDQLTDVRSAPGPGQTRRPRRAQPRRQPIDDVSADAGRRATRERRGRRLPRRSAAAHRDYVGESVLAGRRRRAVQRVRHASRGQSVGGARQGLQPRRASRSFVDAARRQPRARPATPARHVEHRRAEPTTGRSSIIGVGPDRRRDAASADVLLAARRASTSSSACSTCSRCCRSTAATWPSPPTRRSASPQGPALPRRRRASCCRSRYARDGAAGCSSSSSACTSTSSDPIGEQ